MPFYQQKLPYTYYVADGTVPVTVDITFYRKVWDHDNSPIKPVKRTSAFMQKYQQVQGHYRFRNLPLQSGLGSSTEHVELALQPDPSVIASLESQLIIDWDTGIDRVFPDKLEQFNFLATLFELAELKSLATAFIFRATGFFRNVISGVSSLVLMNNLLVIPTMQSIQDANESSSTRYDEAISRLKELQRPTKFSCKPVYRTKRTVDTIVLLSSQQVGGYAFRIVADSVRSYKSVKRGTGILRADTNINRFLLSSLTSGYNVDLGFIWDRIPLSFIIDYFIGIGEVLATDKSDVCTFTAFACSEQTKTTVHSTLENIRVEPIGSAPLPLPMIEVDQLSFADVNYSSFTRYAYPDDNQPSFDGLDPAVFETPGDISISQALNTLLILIGFVLGRG